MDNGEDPDEAPFLSGATLNALEEFYRDRDAHDKRFEQLRATADDDLGQKSLTMDAFAEDWNESQFWYSQETATILANQLLTDSTNETIIAVVSAPSVFVQLKNLLAMRESTEDDKPKIHLLEFDERFGVFPEFVRYDFRTPLNLPASMKGIVDHIICDPPFLSEDCQTKAALTVRWLSKSWGLEGLTSDLSTNKSNRKPPSRLIVCTGERMQPLVNRLYRLQGIRTTTFMPVHAKGLGNEFYCYANFECSDWGWKE